MQFIENTFFSRENRKGVRILENDPSERNVDCVSIQIVHILGATEAGLPPPGGNQRSYRILAFARVHGGLIVRSTRKFIVDYACIR